MPGSALPTTSRRPAPQSGYIDANVIVRHLTDDPPEMAAQASALLAAAEGGRSRLSLTLVTLAEVVWTLVSFYRFNRTDIADQLLLLVTAEGIEMEQKDEATVALSLYRDNNIDFADAVLAAHSLITGPPVIYSFDHHFDRLPAIQRQTPGTAQ